MRLPGKPTILLGAALASVVAIGWYVYDQTQAFADEGLEIQIGHTSYYNGVADSSTSWELADLDDGSGPDNGAYLFYNFSSLLPADRIQNTSQIELVGEQAWACYRLTIIENDDTSCTEPELLSDPTCQSNPSTFDGELAQNLELITWVDDGDGIYEIGESLEYSGSLENFASASATLADADENIFTNSANDPLTPGSEYYLGSGVCFGALTLSAVVPGTGDPETNPGFSCDGSLVGDQTQTDSTLADIEILAIQASLNPDYTCGTCEILGDYGADVVENSAQGLRRDDSPVAADRSNPSSALGLLEGDISSGSFYSLGFGGSLTLSFNYAVPNGAGADFYVYEVTGGGSYPEEQAEVEVSQNGIDFESVGTASSFDGPEVYFNLDSTSFEWIRFVRITDTTDESLFDSRPNADGFDVDGVVGGAVDLCI